jgi:hypothetical protein
LFLFDPFKNAADVDQDTATDTCHGTVQPISVPVEEKPTAAAPFECGVCFATGVDTTQMSNKGFTTHA